MTSFVDVQAAIVAKLSQFAPEIEVNTSDIEEGFKRPCFYVDMVDVNIEKLTNNFEERYIDFDVLYFPKHPKKNLEDLLKMRDVLTDAFVANQVIKISDDLVAEAEEVKIFDVDKVLHCEFKIYIAEEYVKEYEYNMEELEYKEGIDANE
ncbi:MAG: phage tail terminator family protein [Cetobacterium sp.]